MTITAIDHIVGPVTLVATVSGVTIYAAIGVTVDRISVTVFAKTLAGALPPSVKGRALWNTSLSLLVRGGTSGEDA